jgi:hypothetical protein
MILLPFLSIALGIALGLAYTLAVRGLHLRNLARLAREESARRTATDRIGMETLFASILPGIVTGIGRAVTFTVRPSGSCVEVRCPGCGAKMTVTHTALGSGGSAPPSPERPN